MIGDVANYTHLSSMVRTRPKVEIGLIQSNTQDRQGTLTWLPTPWSSQMTSVRWSISLFSASS
jgi:hypothetical protein